jgi:nucleotide-binding universal stress UspA family protein
MYKKILVPLDGSELAECVLPHLDIIAGGCGVEKVAFLRVVKPFYPMSDYMGNSVSAADVVSINDEAFAAAEDYLKKLVEKIKYPGVEIGWEAVKGNEADNIAEYAKKNEVDLILIATHGRSGVSRWFMGSVADRVMRSSCVPVLMVRAPGCIPGI